MGKNESQNKSYALTMIAAFLANALSIVLFLERILAAPFLEMFKDMGGAEAADVIRTFTAFQYISVIGFLASLIWIILVYIGKKEKYILKTRVSVVLIGLFILLIIISIPVTLLLLYAPMFAVVDMIK